MKIKIQDEWCGVENVFDGGYLPSVQLEDGREFYVAEDFSHASEQTMKYWEDMLWNDTLELIL